MVPDGNGVDRVTTDSKQGDLARVVRSMDAGNFHLTFDIIFEDPDTFNRIHIEFLLKG